MCVIKKLREEGQRSVLDYKRLLMNDERFVARVRSQNGRKRRQRYRKWRNRSKMNMTKEYGRRRTGERIHEEMRRKCEGLGRRTRE
jgi:hypothetical protein